ncbi:MAG TPA: bifunctional precorrin-2 dehydrogenase/sirohydrochlorin ferrochelatase [Actinomycetota bacterium]|nr:bifunctional precorrin-2 dehydrogenase/sirohydrochlorin ferrochelatase [Actinomycetota bacterium]
MPFGYPVLLELGGRKAVVIGETAVREGKVEGLLDGGCGHVLVIATEPAGRLAAFEADDPRVVVERRRWQPDDLDGAFVVVASSEVGDDRASIALESRRRGALVNMMDDVRNCDWAAPSVVRRGDLVLAISTGGRSPALARRLRQELSERFGPEWVGVVQVLGAVREETLARIPSLPERSKRWVRALDLDEAAALVREGRRDELEDRLRSRLLEGA